MQPLLRSLVVGKTLVGMRVDDTIRALNWLASRPDVDRSSILLYGKGGLGMVALHTAALDPRVTRVVVENTLASKRQAKCPHFWRCFIRASVRVCTPSFSNIFLRCV